MTGGEEKISKQTERSSEKTEKKRNKEASRSKKSKGKTSEAQVEENCVATEEKNLPYAAENVEKAGNLEASEPEEKTDEIKKNKTDKRKVRLFKFLRWHKKNVNKAKKEPIGFGKLLFRNMLIVFTAMIVFFAVFFAVAMIIIYISVPIPENRMPTMIIIFSLLFLSFWLGLVISTISARRISTPITELENATAEIAKGNFDVQVKEVKNSELNNFIKNFNKMAKELKNNETLKTDFISNVSHEFKTPLAVISAYSKSLRREDLDEKTRKHYEEILDCNIKKLTNLTSNILSLSKIENQEIVIDKTEFLLDEQIRQSILNLEMEWQKKSLEFNLDLPTTKFFGSATLLEQVWQNLISNAIKFTPEGGTISISIKSEENIVVEISDTGIGMDEDTVNHIFDKFYQADKSHSGEGNGLGLALVSRIVKISDGKIDVKSELGKGSTFIITLPQPQPAE